MNRKFVMERTRRNPQNATRANTVKPIRLIFYPATKTPVSKKPMNAMKEKKKEDLYETNKAKMTPSDVCLENEATMRSMIQ